MSLTKQEKIICLFFTCTLILGTALNYCIKRQLSPTAIISFIEDGRYINKVNINSSNHKELTAVPGIGDATAQRVIEWRKRQGTFDTLQQLFEIDGIGERNFWQMKKYLTTTH